MQDPSETENRADDPHDDAFANAGPDPEFENERCWEDAGAMRRGKPLAFTVSTAPNAPIPESRFLIDWIDQHREARYPADPNYLHGTAIDAALDAPTACRVALPYPAARCGMWVVHCRMCGYVIALATTGRADDPRSVRIACKQH